tara:strand:- start:1461 stop:3056 length:1596 start_codon:yes stop_codon:yes gene_type:complete
MNNLERKIDLQYQDQEDSINFKRSLDSVIRGKNIIALATFLSLVSSTVFALVQKPTWQGNIEIVLRSTDSKNYIDSLLQGNSLLESFAKTNTNVGKDLKTQVKVLESPSVLKPVYDLVKSEKTAKGIDTSGENYLDWFKDSLEIDLLKGTSVLKIAYKDTEKELIIPTLNKISKTYQDYSSKGRSRGMELALDFVTEQLEISTIKSKESTLKFQEFSILNGLSSQDGIPMALSPSSSSLTRQNNNLLQQLSQLQSTARTMDGSISMDGSIPERYLAHFQKLNELEAELSFKSSKLKPNSQIITSLQGRVDKLKQSLSRPSEIIIEYRQLKSDSKRDLNTLRSLEDQMAQIKLEIARKEDPWQLISNPVLLDFPVAPNKKVIVGIGILLGFLISTFCIILRDRISGKLYLIDDIKSLLDPYPLLKNLNSINELEQSQSIKLLSNNLLKVTDKEYLGIINLASKKSIDFLTISLKNSPNTRQIKVADNCFDLQSCSKLVIVISNGNVTGSKLESLKEEFLLQDIPIIGWISIN